jgi:hypothetical protein
MKGNQDRGDLLSYNGISDALMRSDSESRERERERERRDVIMISKNG